MAVPQLLEITGSAKIGPPSPASVLPSGSSIIKLKLEQTVQGGRFQARSIASPAAFVDLLSGLGITLVKAVVLKVSGGTLTVRASSTLGGADQQFPLSDCWVWSSPTSGAELTALSVQGTADIEMIVAGNP